MPLTLAIDCGGTGIKGSVLDDDGAMVAKPVRVPTPYPLPPARFLEVLTGVAHGLPRADRVTVGMPGLIRNGTVITTPHYITLRGPHTPVDPRLERAWHGLDIDQAVATSMDLPSLVMNDAEVAGAGAISGYGFEVMITLGTGLGNAIFDGGVLLPHLEISRAPVRRARIYDEYIGDKARRRMGRTIWSTRVREVIKGLQPMLHWDQLYLGGGNSMRLRPADLKAMGPGVNVVSNDVGIIGGVRAWDVRRLRDMPLTGSIAEQRESPAEIEQMFGTLPTEDAAGLTDDG